MYLVNLSTRGEGKKGQKSSKSCQYSFILSYHKLTLDKSQPTVLEIPIFISLYSTYFQNKLFTQTQNYPKARVWKARKVLNRNHRIERFSKLIIILWIVTITSKNIDCYYFLFSILRKSYKSSSLSYKLLPKTFQPISTVCNKLSKVVSVFS